MAKETRKIVFNGGIELGGTLFKLVCELLKEFETDLNSGTLRDHYRFVTAKKLASRVDMNQASLRRAVLRARHDIKKAFAKKFARTLDRDDVIENEGWGGYRLNLIFCW